MVKCGQIVEADGNIYLDFFFTLLQLFLNFESIQRLRRHFGKDKSFFSECLSDLEDIFGLALLKGQ